MKRAWKDRKARNCDEITPELVQSYFDDPRRHEYDGFWEWLGLKQTKTATLRYNAALRKLGEKK